MTGLLKGGRLATTELVIWRGRPAVRKSLRMRPRIPLLSREVDRFLAAREARLLRRAEGVPGVPRLLARPADHVLVREYLPGVALPRAPAPPAVFFDRLLAAVRALHARGIVHNDLHKEANVVVQPDGTPGVLDFQLALALPPGSASLRALALFDVYHVLKNRRHRTGTPFSEAEGALVRRARAWLAPHRLLVKKVANLLTRRIFRRALAKLPTDTDP